MKHQLFIILFFGGVIYYYFFAEKPPRANTLADIEVVDSVSSDAEKTKNVKPPVIKKEARPTKTGKNICNSTEHDLSAFLKLYSENMEKREILYNSEDLSDCSGIFLRFSKMMKSECSSIVLPTPSEARDTRKIARWFYNRKKLRIVHDASNSGHMIKPGAIMFYGTRNMPYEATDLNIDDLTTSGGIQHIGVVTETEKDVHGNVVGYTLYHGRTYGKIAGSTRWHIINPSSSKNPPFGNGDQQWVAMVELL
ncbi:MAG: hypothetical protein AAF502_18005 [Bacteroidota bacterium]